MTQSEEFEEWYEREGQSKPFTTVSIKDKMHEAWQAAKEQAVPDGYTLISTEILDRFPEINLSNYGPDEVDALNAWGIEVVTASVPVKEVI